MAVAVSALFMKLVARGNHEQKQPITSRYSDITGLYWTTFNTRWDKQHILHLHSRHSYLVMIIIILKWRKDNEILTFTSKYLMLANYFDPQFEDFLANKNSYFSTTFFHFILFVYSPDKLFVKFNRPIFRMAVLNKWHFWIVKIAFD